MGFWGILVGTHHTQVETRQCFLAGVADESIGTLAHKTNARLKHSCWSSFVWYLWRSQRRHLLACTESSGVFHLELPCPGHPAARLPLPVIAMSYSTVFPLLRPIRHAHCLVLALFFCQKLWYHLVQSIRCLTVLTCVGRGKFGTFYWFHHRPGTKNNGHFWLKVGQIKFTPIGAMCMNCWEKVPNTVVSEAQPQPFLHIAPIGERASYTTLRTLGLRLWIFLCWA